MNFKASFRTLTSEELETNPERAKIAAEGGPVFIVTDGAVSHVLMTKTDFDLLDLRSQGETSLRDALMHPQGDEFDFDPPRMEGGLFKPPDLD